MGSPNGRVDRNRSTGDRIPGAPCSRSARARPKSVERGTDLPWTLLDHASIAAHEVNDDRDERHDEKNVEKTAHREGGEHAGTPEEEEDDEEKEHGKNLDG